MASQVERDAMRRAIALSALGLGTTSPNPSVGCVILDAADRIVGQGYHERKGEPHAEVHALHAAGNRARGGTAVVTLEPCNHHGRTPPCHQALIDAGIRRVIVALIDPTSRAEGGVAKLRAACLDVEVGVLADEARLVLGPWLEALQTGRPHVTWLATSDEVLPAVAADLEQLRTRNDAVLFDDGHAEEGVANSHGQGVLQLDPTPLSAGPAAVLTSLYAGGVRSLLLCGGWPFAEPFVSAGAVDQVVVYVMSQGPATRPAGDLVESSALMPAGFVITRIMHMGDLVKVVGAAVGRP